MSDKVDDDPRALRALIEQFIRDRLADQLDKPKNKEPERQARKIAEHATETWLASAATRVTQLQLATHTLKAIHPDARGSTIFLQIPSTTADAWVGTHSLKSTTFDVVGNAAALDVFKLLKLEYARETLIERLLRDDPCAKAALSDDPNVAMEWATAFASIAKTKDGARSHTLAKQVYFPVGDDQYHLLAPLYPSVMVHNWHQKLQTDRWGEPAKAAREARRKQKPSTTGFVEYPGLAVQSFGGTKPQNISQLNSERGGKTHLLSSLPPNWNSQPIRAPMNCKSVFDQAFPKRKQVKELTDKLRNLLYEHRARDDNNIAIRRARAEMVESIVGELLIYASEIRSLKPGWSTNSECKLGDTQIAWLDPYSVTDEDRREEPTLFREWPERVSKQFALWLNASLQTKKTVLSDMEVVVWKHELLPYLESLQKALEGERDDRLPSLPLEVTDVA